MKKTSSFTEKTGIPEKLFKYTGMIVFTDEEIRKGRIEFTKRLIADVEKDRHIHGDAHIDQMIETILSDQGLTKADIE